jgi:hypothetical protein
MGSRGPKSGDSYTVERLEPGSPPVIGRATSPRRALALAARYRYEPAAEGTTVEVTGHNGASWRPWRYEPGGWVRAALPGRHGRGVTMRYFISGHLDLTPEEFAEHYTPALAEAARDPKAAFVVGDARGADRMAQDWLVACGIARGQVTVYHMLTAPRHNTGGFPTVGGFTGDEQRDAAASAASDADIAWVRPGRRKSGTARNLARRR